MLLMNRLSKWTCLFCLAGAIGFTHRNVISAPPTKAEMDRKLRDLKKDGEEMRRRIETQQRETRAKLNIPESKATTAKSASTSASSATQKSPLTQTSMSAATSASASAGTSSKLPPVERFDRLIRSPFEYRFQRGLEFAFEVQLQPKTDSEPRWVGRPYVRVMYPHHDNMPALVMVLGKLECIRPDGTRLPKQDISLPTDLWISSTGPLQKTLASMLTPHVLPRQMSSIFPYEQLLFPAVPQFTNSPLDHSEGEATRYLMGNSGMSELKGAASHALDLKQESGKFRTIQTDGYLSQQGKIGQKCQQISVFNAQDTMLSNSSIDYTLRWNGDHEIQGSVQRLSGSEVSAARDKALTSTDLSKLPKKLWRVPVDPKKVSGPFIKSTRQIAVNETVLVTQTFSVQSSNLLYTFRGQVLKVLSDDRALVKLEGSSEEIEVHSTLIHKL